MQLNNHNLSQTSNSSLKSPVIKKPKTLLNPVTFIQFRDYNFLIFDAPSPSTLPLYIKEFEKYKVDVIVRVCEATYSKEKLEALNIKVYDLGYSDGEAPPKHIVTKWLEIIEEHHQINSDSGRQTTIGIHCVAGLGRAPVLVAIFLIEQGMSHLDSVQFVREKRKGAINNKQIKYIESYRRQNNKGKCNIF